MVKTSKIHKFYEKSQDERLEILKDFADLSEEEIKDLKSMKALDFETADRMIENVYSCMQLPLGIATNFVINNKEYLIPMALEEPSVVAAASNAAKLALPEGFEAQTTDPIMIGQIQIVDVKKMDDAKRKIEFYKKELLELCNSKDPTLVRFGGGARDIEIREVDTSSGKMLIVHLLVDVRDAMGANAINTMAEAIAGKLEELTEGKVRLRIISNLALARMARAKAVWKKHVLGEDVIDKILDSYALAEADQFRATTHNKGIMNGVDALVIATGNDFRAIEAGAHSFASITGKYLPLTKYYKDSDGNLVGEIEMPMALGLVGGATRSHPAARIAIKILKVKTASELAGIAASLGLAQNFAALRALSTEGIQQGHMKLHAKNVAVQAGASKENVDKIAKKMIEEKNINAATAEKLVKEMQ